MVVGAIGGGNAGPTKSLWVDGTDVLKQTGGAGGFGTLLSSIEHTENAPPGVSSLKFTIRDPGKAITLRRGMWVLYHNHVTDRPYFRGFLQTWTMKPDGLGRVFSVRCIGVDALPDWCVVPSLSLPAGTTITQAILAAAAVAITPGIQLRAFATQSINDTGGSQGGPIAAFTGDFGNIHVDLVVDYVQTSAMSLRETINALFAASKVSIFDEFSGALSTAPYIGVTTVDPWLGLRVYGKTSTPSDYATLTVLDTPAGTFVADGLGHAVDVGDVPAGVFVQGGTPAGTGPTPLGDGLPGPIRILSAPGATTDAGRRAAASAYLADHGAITQRGGFRLDDNAVTTNVRAGSLLDLTDAETGATGTYKIAQIVRTFTALRETWQVTYGGLPPSVTRSIRRLTRGTLS